MYEKIKRDSEYQKTIDSLRKAVERHNHYFLKLEEKKFENRYGVFPFEIDYDSWIDNFHVGMGGTMSPAEIDADMAAFGYSSNLRTNKRNLITNAQDANKAQE